MTIKGPPDIAERVNRAIKSKGIGPKMKLKILLFLFLAIFLITGAALAMPQIERISSFPEPAAMLLFGACLIGMAIFGRKMFLSKS